jgi:hypothetical protein
MDATWDDYRLVCGETCDLLFYWLGVPSKSLLLVPISFLTNVAFPICAAKIRDTEVFERLYPSELLKGFFFESWKEALLDQMDSEAPTPDSPLALGSDFCIVAVDPDLVWSSTTPRGAYYVLNLGADKITKPLRTQVRSSINDLNVLRASVTSEDVKQATNAYEIIDESVSEKPDWFKLRMAAKRLPMKLHVAL